MENESIRSEPNSRSRRSKNTHHHIAHANSNHTISHSHSQPHNSSSSHHHNSSSHSHSQQHLLNGNPPPLPPPSQSQHSATAAIASTSAGGTHSHRDRSTRHSHRSNHSRKRPDMAPFQTTVNLEDGGRDCSGQPEIIEVQILPQDDNWGENTTAITGNTSEQSLSMEDVSNWPMAGSDGGLRLSCQRYVESTLALALTAAAFFSPLAMVVLPKLGIFAAAFERAEMAGTAAGLGRPAQQLLACNAECKGGLVSLAARMVLLALGLWALFLRQPVATMPRIFLFRATAMLLVLLATFAYWLFYMVQVSVMRWPSAPSCAGILLECVCCF